MPGIPQHTPWWYTARSQFVINASCAGPLAGLADIRPRTYAEGEKKLPRGERRTLRQKTCVNAFPLFSGMMGTGPHLASTSLFEQLCLSFMHALVMASTACQSGYQVTPATRGMDIRENPDTREPRSTDLPHTDIVVITDNIRDLLI